MPTPSRLSINCSVLSALFPEISIAEIDGLSSDTFDHDTIGDLPYLEACIKEAMR